MKMSQTNIRPHTGQNVILVVSVLGGINLVNQMDRVLFSLMVEPIKAELGLSDGQMGLLGGLAFAVCFAVMGLVAGRVADRAQHLVVGLLSHGQRVHHRPALAYGLDPAQHRSFVAAGLITVGEQNDRLGLIEVAKRDPDIQNRRKFSTFLEWANDEGIIDKIQARNYYNRYFNTTFMSLPDDYNVCSSCSEKSQRDLEIQLEAELGQKEEGLLKACQDKDAYYIAMDQYDSILLLLDATCTACR